MAPALRQEKFVFLIDNALLDAADLASALRAYASTAERVGLPAPTAIGEPGAAPTSFPGGWSALEGRAAGASSVSVFHGDGPITDVICRREGGFVLGASVLVDGVPPEHVEQGFGCLVRLFGELARGGIRGADGQRPELHRVSPVRAAPDPPCSPALAHGLLLPASDIEAAYGTLARFAAHGWSLEACPHGTLAMRATSASRDLDFVRETMLHQRALARIAPPRKTRYYALDMSDEIQRYYASFPATLRSAYVDAEQAAIYTAVLPRDGHVQGWEVDAILEILRRRALPDGRPVAEARVIFSDRATAERERRPLLDIGARVLTLDASNALVDVPET
jgi:hypothetical protein